MKTIEFTIHRTGWTTYQALVPDDFDDSDDIDLLELADGDAVDIDGETTHLTIVREA